VRFALQKHRKRYRRKQKKGVSKDFAAPGKKQLSGTAGRVKAKFNMEETGRVS
jgi:hypothetical protein